MESSFDKMSGHLANVLLRWILQYNFLSATAICDFFFTFPFSILLIFFFFLHFNLNCVGTLPCPCSFFRTTILISSNTRRYYLNYGQTKSYRHRRIRVSCWLAVLYFDIVCLLYSENYIFWIPFKHSAHRFQRLDCKEMIWSQHIVPQ